MFPSTCSFVETVQFQNLQAQEKYIWEYVWAPVK